jgi:hypothetical protein
MRTNDNGVDREMTADEIAAYEALVNLQPETDQTND